MISNYKFKELVERIFYIRWWVKYLYIANNIIPGGNQHTGKTQREIKISRDVNGTLYKTKKLKEAYFNFSEEEHAKAKKYLNRIKLCALTNVATDYSAGLESWSTYNDGAPISMSIALSFTELLPVFYEDYEQYNDNRDGVGF